MKLYSKFISEHFEKLMFFSPLQHLIEEEGKDFLDTVKKRKALYKLIG